MQRPKEGNQCGAAAEEEQQGKQQQARMPFAAVQKLTSGTGAGSNISESALDAETGSPTLSPAVHSAEPSNSLTYSFRSRSLKEEAAGAPAASDASDVSSLAGAEVDTPVAGVGIEEKGQYSIRVRAAAKCMQGRRPQQEDRHVLILDAVSFADESDRAALEALQCKPTALIALFDGHCGATCSEFCAQHLPSRLLSYLVKPLPKSKSRQFAAAAAATACDSAAAAGAADSTDSLVQGQRHKQHCESGPAPTVERIEKAAGSSLENRVNSTDNLAAAGSLAGPTQQALSDDANGAVAASDGHHAQALRKAEAAVSAQSRNNAERSLSDSSSSAAAQLLYKLSVVGASAVPPLEEVSPRLRELLPSVGARIGSAFRHIDKEFLSKYRTYKGGGSTAVVLLLLGNVAFVAAVGDSRAVAGVLRPRKRRLLNQAADSSRAATAPADCSSVAKAETRVFCSGNDGRAAAAATTAEKEEVNWSVVDSNLSGVASDAATFPAVGDDKELREKIGVKLSATGEKAEVADGAQQRSLESSASVGDIGAEILHRKRTRQTAETEHSSWEALRVTRDHKPDDPEEQNRIEKHGGRVVWISGVPRVASKDYEERAKQMKREQCLHGSATQPPPVLLAVSRGFGDRELKEEQLLTATPDVMLLLLSPQIRFLVIACDGVWDVMSDQEVIDIASQYINDPQEAGSQVVKRAFQRGSQDNLTAIVVVFDYEDDRK